jgi:hypothetical protein
MSTKRKAATKRAEHTNGFSNHPAAGPLARIPADESALRAMRVRINKAYKMYVGGAFVRSESGRYFQVSSRKPDGDADPETVNVPRGSRKDVRDAVLVAKNAEAGWAGRTAFNRSQILYRLAEVLESRASELEASLRRSGESTRAAATEVAATIDRAVFYAGFADKFHALLASSNPVTGPHFGFSVPEPLGVVAAIAPKRPALLGLAAVALPIAAGGNTCVVLASDEDPRTAIVFSECLATSDMPGGVINVLTGHAKELGPVMAKHREVFGLDVWVDDDKLTKSLQDLGADNIKRVKVHAPMSTADWLDDRRGQGLGWIERYLETKTVWHPVGV